MTNTTALPIPWELLATMPRQALVYAVVAEALTENEGEHLFSTPEIARLVVERGGEEKVVGSYLRQLAAAGWITRTPWHAHGTTIRNIHRYMAHVTPSLAVSPPEWEGTIPTASSPDGDTNEGGTTDDD